MGDFFQFTRQVSRQEASVDPSGEAWSEGAWNGKERRRSARDSTKCQLLRCDLDVTSFLVFDQRLRLVQNVHQHATEQQGYLNQPFHGIPRGPVSRPAVRWSQGGPTNGKTRQLTSQPRAARLELTLGEPKLILPRLPRAE